MPNYETAPQVTISDEGEGYGAGVDNRATEWESPEFSFENEEIGQPFVKEIELAGGEVINLPSLKVVEASVYHGSPVKGIKEFNIDEGDQFTIGRGIYVAPRKETAVQYANTRSNKTPGIVYEARIRDMEIADLRDIPGQIEFSKLLRQEIVAWAERTLPNFPDETGYDKMLKEVWEKKVSRVTSTIDDRAWKRISLRDVTHDFNTLVATSLSRQGYSGLIGCEGEDGAVDNHDSIVIFDESDLEIISETEL